MNGYIEATVRGNRVVDLGVRPPVAAKILPGPNLLIVGSAAGLLESDRTRIALHLEAGARLTVKTVAATLAHACPGGGETETDVLVDAGPGARLAWLPEPLVAHAGCNHRSAARVELAPGAVALWQETLALGRSGEDAGDVELHLHVDLDGRPLLRDSLHAGSSAPAAKGPAVLGGARHAGTLALFGTRPPNAPMALAGPGALARAVAADGAALERLLGPTRRLFLDHLDDTESFCDVA